MREIARDQVEIMQKLGYDEFGVAGHDRGARCAYRMALNHPAVITRLAVLDIIPTGEAFRRADRDFSLGWRLPAGAQGRVHREIQCTRDHPRHL